MIYLGDQVWMYFYSLKKYPNQNVVLNLLCTFNHISKENRVAFLGYNWDVILAKQVLVLLKTGSLSKEPTFQRNFAKFV